MSDLSFEEIDDLFHRCLELPPDARSIFLDQRCQDAKLRATLEDLLAADDGDSQFLEPPCLGRLKDHFDEGSDVDIGERLGPYEVKRLLARGGMGSVFLAVRADREFEQTVAIKTIRAGLRDSDSVERFRLERQTLARFDHPYIARLFDGGTTEAGSPYLVMEYIKGEPIDFYCQRLQLGLHERIQLFESVLKAVEYAHRNLIIHRDLKPSNILVTDEGVTKLLDFGISQAFGSHSEGPSATPHALTPTFASPEQRRGESLTTASDVYSLGVVLRVLLSGDPKSEASHIPKDLKKILAKSLSPELEDRYRSVTELGLDLKRWQERLPISARPHTPFYTFSRFLSRHLWTGGVGLLLLMTLTTWAFDTHKRQQSAQLHLDEILRLSDLHDLERLKRGAELLPKAHPDSIEIYARWVKDARALTSRLDVHRQTLQYWRRSSLSLPTGESGFRFETTADQWRHDTLARLVESLEDFSQAENGLMESVVRRFEYAKNIVFLTIEDALDQWAVAIEEIASEDICPQYRGLELSPQLGLIPLGQDEESGLWEFLVLESGEAPLANEEGGFDVTEETGIILVLLPGGSSRRGALKPSPQNPLGSPHVDPQANENESPLVEMEIEPFFFSKYEITQAQWKRMSRGENPSALYSGYSKIVNQVFDDTHPVENVSWDEATASLAAIGLCLPSEDRWEYAARAGTTTPWWTGSTEQSLEGAANIADLTVADNDIEWVRGLNPTFRDGYIAHAPVDALRPNGFGLHHTAGNVMEWCLDPINPDLPYTRVYRGGSFNYASYQARSSFRRGGTTTFRAGTIGVRAARDIDWE